MPITSLSFDNKNQYRRYPLKQSATCVADDGSALPNELVTNCSITTIYGKHRLYIKQIAYAAGRIDVTIASVFDDIAVGVFSGAVSAGYAAITLAPFTRYVSGNITIDSKIALLTPPGILSFNKAATELEESVIFCYTPPGVRSILDSRGNELRGDVRFGTLTNLTKTTSDKTTRLTATNPASVFNLRDKSSILGNCPTPMIKNINSVFPQPMDVGSPDNDGNIYIAGVKPIIFYGLRGDSGVIPGAVGVSSGAVTLDSLCTKKHKLLPPIDVSGFTLPTPEFTDLYYSKPALPAYPEGASASYPLPSPARLASNLNNTTRPEYYYWPQFVKSEYYDFWFKE
jgi:hypothetical protein